MSVFTRTAVAAGFASATLTLTLGCGGGEKPAEQAPPPTTGAPATTLAAPAAMPPVAAGDFGVAECDNYMKKYMACVDSKVPETARAMMRQQLDQTRAAWKQAASTPQGKAGLAMGCQQADQASAPAMKAYGCTW